MVNPPEPPEPFRRWINNRTQHKTTIFNQTPVKIVFNEMCPAFHFIYCIGNKYSWLSIRVYVNTIRVSTKKYGINCNLSTISLYVDLLRALNESLLLCQHLCNRRKISITNADLLLWCWGWEAASSDITVSWLVIGLSGDRNEGLWLVSADIMIQVSNRGWQQPRSQGSAGCVIETVRAAMGLWTL